MAFNTTESVIFEVTAGAESLLLLVGTYVNTGGSVGGVIEPGFPTVGPAANNLSVQSSYMREIVGNGWFTSFDTPGASELNSLKSFNNTNQGDQLTITSGANESGFYYILGKNAGG